MSLPERLKQCREHALLDPDSRVLDVDLKRQLIIVFARLSHSKDNLSFRRKLRAVAEWNKVSRDRFARGGGGIGKQHGSFTLTAFESALVKTCRNRSRSPSKVPW